MRDGETFTAAAPIRSASATHDAEQPCPEDAPAPVPTPEEPIAQVIPAPTEGSSIRIHGGGATRGSKSYGGGKRHRHAPDK
jgi:hypothetical protein